MKKTFIELWSREENRSIFGNMDGQGIINAKQYKRTDYYKSLRGKLATARKYRKDESLFYKIVTPEGKLLETIDFSAAP